MKKGKKYQAALAKIDAKKIYTIEEACALVKETSTVKFDATVDVSFRFNVDPKYADQQLRGTLVLPHGNGKTKKILAITHKEEEAKQAQEQFRTNAAADGYTILNSGYTYKCKKSNACKIIYENSA